MHEQITTHTSDAAMWDDGTRYEACLHHVLICIDPRYTLASRKRIAGIVEQELIDHPHMAQRILVELLISGPPACDTAGLPLTGVFGDIIEQMQEKWDTYHLPN